MAASPVLVTDRPLYLSARTNIYDARDLRRPYDDLEIGPGVQDYDSFRVRQRVAGGAGMAVDVGGLALLHKAYVRGVTVQDQGMYRVARQTTDAVLTLDVPAAHATLPRVDSVYLAVEDQQETGGNNQATLRLVSGVATSGATLDNRTGAGAVPTGMSSILLGDLLVPAAATTVTTANIRDRRPFGQQGVIPPLGSFGTQVDAVMFEPHPALMRTGGAATAISQVANHSNCQAAVLCYLPRRVRFNRFRWKFLQGSTAMGSSYVLGVYDASGRLIVSGGAGFPGAANTFQDGGIVVTDTTLDSGSYFCMFGADTIATSGSAFYHGVLVEHVTGLNSIGAPMRNLGVRTSTGGITPPTTLGAMSDLMGLTSPAGTPAVPLFGLSFG